MSLENAFPATDGAYFWMICSDMSDSLELPLRDKTDHACLITCAEDQINGQEDGQRKESGETRDGADQTTLDRLFADDDINQLLAGCSWIAGTQLLESGCYRFGIRFDELFQPRSAEPVGDCCANQDHDKWQNTSQKDKPVQEILCIGHRSPVHVDCLL
jgi:hypothetical protein